MSWHSTDWPRKKKDGPAEGHPRAPPGGQPTGPPKAGRGHKKLRKRSMKDYLTRLKAKLDKEKLGREP